MGIIGTVMGLVNVLSHLDKPDELGKSIATAFIATLYGVLSANVFWLPIGERLKQRNKEEVARRTLAVEGVLSVQAGDNPRVVREKLEAFLPLRLRGEEAAGEEAVAGGEASKQAAAA
jgi:chemotaxis protein MotA